MTIAHPADYPICSLEALRVTTEVAAPLERRVARALCAIDPEAVASTYFRQGELAVLPRALPTALVRVRAALSPIAHFLFKAAARARMPRSP